MKIDKQIKDLAEKLDNLSDGNGHDNNYHYDQITATVVHDDEYYLANNTQPPRFGYYRLARAKKTINGTKTFEDVYDTITQDELDFNLKRNLRIPPEERYQAQKSQWFFHDTSYLGQTTDDNGRLVDVVKEYGCGHGSIGGGCVPECRFYPRYGRIEDEEVIREHKEFEQRYRDKNAIVEPPSPLDYQEA